jgi:hypothetical protein
MSDIINGCKLAQSLVNGAVYTFSFSGTDAAGNVAVVVTSTGVTFDNTAPVISVGAPSRPISKIGPVTYTITYADANFNSSTLAIGNITLNKTSTANGTLSVDVSSGSTRTVTISNITGNGTLGITIAAGTASDKAGNLAPASVASATFIADNTPPSLEWVTPVISGSVYTVRDQSVQLETTVSDNTGVSTVIFYRWCPETACPPAGELIEIGRVTAPPYHLTFDATVLNPGYNEIDAYAYDAAGNESAYRYIWLNHLPTLIIKKSGTGSGTVTSTPAVINCGSVCAYGFDPNTLVTLTATPMDNSVFVGFIGACDGTGPCTVKMDHDHTMIVVFDARYKLFLPFVRR